jgi:predicted ATPase
LPARKELAIDGYLGSLPANSIVGRERELEAVTSAIDSVVSGTGKLVLLAGEPGVGKTRMAQEVTLALRNRDFVIAAGRCYEAQQAVPFYPFVEALTTLYAEAPRSIQAEVPRGWPDLARLLPALGLPLSDYAGPQDQQRLFWAVTGFVQSLARESPIAMLLDDLHWSDAATLELVLHLARHTGADRILLFATYRDVEVNRQHPLEAALRDLNREGLLERVDLRRLDERETSALMAAAMGEEEISEEFTQLVYGRTEGNAFFVQQVMRALVEQGDVFRRDGRWDRRAVNEIEVGGAGSSCDICPYTLEPPPATLLTVITGGG